MSYRHVFAGDAQRDWQKLEIGLQEAVLDELDRLSEVPPTSADPAQLVHDFVVDAPGTRYVLFLYLGISHANRMITVLSVGHFADSVDGAG